ncbi:hypothetical protein ACTPEF_25495, partial [Clostridioides difficile]
KAFSTTGRYDALISSYFAGEVGDTYPDILNLTFQKEQTLRYGKLNKGCVAMIRYYKTIDSKLEKLSFFEDGCWINLVEPNHSEI